MADPTRQRRRRYVQLLRRALPSAPRARGDHRLFDRRSRVASRQRRARTLALAQLWPRLAAGAGDRRALSRGAAIRRRVADRHLGMELWGLRDLLRAHPQPPLQGRRRGRTGNRLGISTTRSIPSATWACRRNGEAYEGSSVLNAADRLNGPLLIQHGTSDDNVHMANTCNSCSALS